MEAIQTNQPDTIADLGGGTGFILKQLLKQQNLLKTIRLINVDISPLQQLENMDQQIINIQTSIDQLTRNQLQPNKNGLMLIARSILHYFGEANLKDILQQIRNLLKNGEIFIHQTACFEKITDAQCLNEIYKLMDTQKWYTTINVLKSVLTDVGFQVYEVCTASNLQLESNDLVERYHLNSERVKIIQEQIEQKYGQKTHIFTCSPGNFTAWLHYTIFSCKAI
ncbi:MAG: class I SAM-dependent methyltransferase [Candidatus Bathyarchaeota archaeon]|jgi:trans-aconitate methyltransferase